MHTIITQQPPAPGQNDLQAVQRASMMRLQNGWRQSGSSSRIALMEARSSLFGCRLFVNSASTRSKRRWVG